LLKLLQFPFVLQPFVLQLLVLQLLSVNSNANSRKKNNKLLQSLKQPLLPESSRRIKKKNKRLDGSKLPQVLHPLSQF